MANGISHSTPHTVARGMQDLSIPEAVAGIPGMSTFYPHLFFFAPKGTDKPTPVTSTAAINRYGYATFDDSSRYATHQSVLARLIGTTGCTYMASRMVPKNLSPALIAAGKENAYRARLIIWVEVSEAAAIPQYQRNSDGTFTLDANGDPIPLVTGGVPQTLSGRSIRWLVTSGNPTDENIGKQVKVEYPSGDATHWHFGATKTTRYPIFEMYPEGYGRYYNNLGLSIWPVNVEAEDAPTATEMYNSNSYFYNFAVVRRSSNVTAPKMITSKDRRNVIEVALNEDIRNSVTSALMSVGDTLAPLYWDVGDFHVYEDNLKTVQQLLWNTEKAYAAQYTEVKDADNDNYRMLNVLTAVSFNSIPYRTIRLETDYAGSIYFAEGTNVLMTGGTDGTMDLEVFDYLVAQEMAKYTDNTSEYMNPARFPQSCVIDSGFGVDTKKAMAKIMAIRKDTLVMQCTYVVGGTEMSQVDEKALGIALRTYDQMYPESTYYGTAAARGILMSRYGTLAGSTYKHKLPLIIELAYKCAKFMGAGNGKWKSKHLFDIAPNNEFTMFTDINNTWTPVSLRKADWVTAGMNFPLDSSRTTCFLPGFRTIYNEETSVLVSAFTMFACVELQKIMERVWYRVTGAIRYNASQLIERVNQEIEKECLGKFADLFVIKPESYISGGDAYRGYSWSTKVTIYSNNMMTATTIDLDVRRMSDLDTAA